MKLFDNNIQFREMLQKSWKLTSGEQKVNERKDNDEIEWILHHVTEICSGESILFDLCLNTFIIIKHHMLLTQYYVNGSKLF